MAEKEERILITKCPGECEHLWYKDADQEFPYGANKPLNNFCCAEGVKDWTKGDRSQKTKLVKPSIDCKKCKQAKYRGMTRQEAIERMAKANWIATVCAKNQCVPVDITKEQWDEEWEKLRIDYKKVYYAGAAAALNALLEGK